MLGFSCQTLPPCCSGGRDRADQLEIRDAPAGGGSRPQRYEVAQTGIKPYQEESISLASIEIMDRLAKSTPAVPSRPSSLIPREAAPSRPSGDSGKAIVTKPAAIRPLDTSTEVGSKEVHAPLALGEDSNQLQVGKTGTPQSNDAGTPQSALAVMRSLQRARIASEEAEIVSDPRNSIPASQLASEGSFSAVDQSGKRRDDQDAVTDHRLQLDYACSNEWSGGHERILDLVIPKRNKTQRFKSTRTFKSQSSFGNGTFPTWGRGSESSDCSMDLEDGYEDSLLRQILSPAGKRLVAICCLAVIVLLTIAFITFTIVLGNSIGNEFMVIEDELLRGDPSYLPDFFAKKCLRLKKHFAPVLERLETYNKDKGWRRVVFPSRGDAREVEALYFPSTTGSARVVLGHSLGTNFLHHSVQTAAYFLRAMNISVLVPNLRNHGGNGTGELKKEWRGQFKDILGAWDYAVADPKRELDGQVNASRVGLMGFEFGGLAVQTAFGMEPRIPAMLLDGSVHDAQALVRQLVTKRLGESMPDFVVDLLADQAWSRCEGLAGGDLMGESSASASLASRSAAGQVGIIHSQDDTVVIVDQKDMLIESLKAAGNPELDVPLEWYPELRGAETATCEGRREVHLDQPKEYMASLCGFWSSVFHRRVVAGNDPLCANAAAEVFGPPLPKG